MKDPTRAELERVRLMHIIMRMRGTMDALEIAMNQGDIPFGDTGVSATANELVTCLARHDAYLFAARDGKASAPPQVESEAKPKFVCDTCKDTHWMYFGEDHDDVMCTRCPVPCEKCRSRMKGGGGGPFCAKTPCACDCHVSTQARQGGGQ